MSQINNSDETPIGSKNTNTKNTNTKNTQESNGLLSAYEDFVKLSAFYPAKDTKSIEAATYIAISLSGEVGEIAEILKKQIRDRALRPAHKINELDELQRQNLVKELGDVCWYIVRFAHELGLDFSTILQMNQAKLEDRIARGVQGGSGNNR